MEEDLDAEALVCSSNAEVKGGDEGNATASGLADHQGEGVEGNAPKPVQQPNIEPLEQVIAELTVLDDSVLELPPVQPPLEPEFATLPDGQKVVASMARPFLAMLPLSDQTHAEDGHVLMIPVQLSYPTMATLLARPPVTTPFMTAAHARALSEAMEALVHSGQLRVSHTPDGPTVGYFPGCEPPKAGERAPPPPPHEDDDQVHEFQRAARDALRKQIEDETLMPQAATPMADLGANEPVYPPPTPPQATGLKRKPRQPRASKVKPTLNEAFEMSAAAVQAMAQQNAATQATCAQQEDAARMKTSMQMAAQAEMVRQQEEAMRQQQQQQHAVSTTGGQHPPLLLQPAQVTRRLTWQEHLVGWQIQAEQYTSGGHHSQLPMHTLRPHMNLRRAPVTDSSMLINFVMWSYTGFPVHTHAQVPLSAGKCAAGMYNAVFSCSPSITARSSPHIFRNPRSRLSTPVVHVSTGSLSSSIAAPLACACCKSPERHKWLTLALAS